MKKKIHSIILMILCLACFSACAKQYTVPQSMEHFVLYKDELYIIAKNYNCSVEQLHDINYLPDNLYCAYKIHINDQEWITVSFFNSAIEEKKGIETFSIVNERISDGVYRQFNIKLLLDIINAFSGRELDEYYIKDFLNTSVEKSSIVFNGKDYDQYVVYNSQSLDFWENWIVTYKCTNKNVEFLEFGGLTKKSAY